MCEFNNQVFESRENEMMFHEICLTLKNHPFESPWSKSFYSSKSEENFVCSVDEFDLPCGIDSMTLPVFSKTHESCSKHLLNKSENVTSVQSESPKVKMNEKLFMLKDSFMNMKDILSVEDIKGIDVLCTLPLSQVPELCDVLCTSLSNESAVALFLNAILNLNKPISISVATALISSIVYPKVLEIKQNSSRNFLTSILNFSEKYPKASIDELIVQCLKNPTLENLQLETLSKLVKCNIPNEYVPYCIRSILEDTLPNESTFAVLQSLIERKCHFELNIHDVLAKTMETWSASCSNNIKFTKLIISILTICGSEFQGQQLLSYQHTVKNNKTFMKKAAENALKKMNT